VLIDRRIDRIWETAAIAVTGLAAIAAAALPTAMALRMDLLLCLADVFVGGVLSTLSARVIGGLLCGSG
jgi:hypothetical protein